MSILLSALLLLLPQPSMARRCDLQCRFEFKEPLTFENLQNFIVNNGIKKMDDVLPCLPKEMFANFTLVHASHSSRPDCYDPQHPRVILFGKDSRQIIAFPGELIKPDCDFIEMIDFDETKAEFHPRKIDFSGRAESMPSIEANPGTCVGCHSTDAHANMESYDFWPGFYGSFDDKIIPGSYEDAEYKKFLKKKLEGRYCLLYQGFDHAGVYPYLTPEKNPGNDEYPYILAAGQISERPNLRMTLELMRLNVKRIIRKFKLSKKYPQYKYLLAAAMRECSGIEIPKWRKDELTASLDKQFKDKMSQSTDSKNDPYVRDFPGVKAIAEVRYLASLMDVDISDWTMTPEKNNNNFETGLNNFSIYLYSELLRQMMQEDPALKKYVDGQIEFDASQQQTDYGAGYDRDLRTYEITSGACDLLMKKNKIDVKALNLKLKTENPPNNASAAPMKGDQCKAPKLALDECKKLGEVSVEKLSQAVTGNASFSTCLQCHGGEKPSAPVFHVESCAALKKQLREKKYDHGTLYDEIVHRLSTDDESRMPPSRASSEKLNYEQKVKQREESSALADYLFEAMNKDCGK